jgi:uncharacterized protein Yka (UPF0111/DUF47 family)
MMLGVGRKRFKMRWVVGKENFVVCRRVFATLYGVTENRLEELSSKIKAKENFIDGGERSLLQYLS